VSAVTNMAAMFRGLSTFNQDISTWDVGNVTEMGAMFNNAIAFNQNLSGWNTINVTGCGTFADNSAMSASDLPVAGSCDFE